jgi:hypothetical protein
MFHTCQAVRLLAGVGTAPPGSPDAATLSLIALHLPGGPLKSAPPTDLRSRVDPDQEARKVTLHLLLAFTGSPRRRPSPRQRIAGKCSGTNPLDPERPRDRLVTQGRCLPHWQMVAHPTVNSPQFVTGTHSIPDERVSGEHAEQSEASVTGRAHTHAPENVCTKAPPIPPQLQMDWNGWLQSKTVQGPALPGEAWAIDTLLIAGAAQTKAPAPVVIAVRRKSSRREMPRSSATTRAVPPGIGVSIMHPT